MHYKHKIAFNENVFMLHIKETTWMYGCDHTNGE